MTTRVRHTAMRGLLVGWVLLAASIAAACAPAGASASSAWWHLSAGPVPSNLAPGGSGTITLHVGNLRTALLAWLFARSQEARFLVRVEDLDTGRVRERFVGEQLHDLATLGLDWDGPVVRQSERLALYEDAVDRLRADGLVYECWCTRAEIREAASAPHGALPEGAYPGTCRDLTAADVRKALAQMADGYSTAAVTMGHLALKRAIRHAEANDLVSRNVAALADTPKGREGRPSKSLTLDQAVERVQAMRDAAVAVNPEILVLCHGGPIAEPRDAAYVLSRTTGVARFFGASSMERLPVERALTAQVREFTELSFR